MNEISYIGECEHEECEQPATRWIAVEDIRTAPVSRKELIAEDQAYLCDEHAEEARQSTWDVVEDFAAEAQPVEKEDAEQ